MAETHRTRSGELKLWYRRPAEQWTEALPVGNGRIGAMVFGGVDTERIQLNEGTLWAGGPYDPSRPEALAALPEVRRLIFEGKYAEAQKLANDKLMGRPLGEMPYQTVGDLEIRFDGGGPVSDYRRELDLDDAVVRVSYWRDGVRFERETFASAPADLLALRFSADRPGALNFEYSLVSAHESSTETALPDTVRLHGRNSERDDVPGKLNFEARAVVHTDGNVTSSVPGSLKVTGATSALVIVVVATNFVSFSDLTAVPETRNRSTLQACAGRSHRDLFRAHVKDYRNLFDRVLLDLGCTERAALPTDERIKLFGSGGDPHLATLYFQFGRYLLIACSRPPGQPATLQGLWNESLNPPWGSKYTVNINTEMNYWPAEITHLPECVEPLVKMVEELAVTGARTAKVNYGAQGWVCHHNTDLWRGTAPVDGAFWGMWPMGGAWLCRQLWERYRFGGDDAYLRRVYPLLKGAAEFFLDTLVEEPSHGWLVTAPSISPENAHHPGVSICAGPTMDESILRDLFGSVMDASETLGLDAGFRERVKHARSRLAPLQIGREGQLQEWLEDWDAQAPEQHHRHVSHLYALHPSDQITRESPDLFRAARKTLEMRGDAGTGWSLAWKINFWARLEDGDRAYKLLGDLLSSERTYPNLFDAHPPFQIDGNFGGASGITEMLLGSHGAQIRLLPALPAAWPSGSVQGLCARDGFDVNLRWENGGLKRAEIYSRLGKTCRVRADVPFRLEGHRSSAASQNPPQTGSGGSRAGAGRQREYVLEFPTTPGALYTIVA